MHHMLNTVGISSSELDVSDDVASDDIWDN